MQLKEIETNISLIDKGEISLSGKDLSEVIQTTFAKGACVRFKVTGFSMSPFILNSDVITLAPPHSPPIGIGRAVAFFNPETSKLIIHRIVGKEDGGYLIKGDNVLRPDGFVPEENILGYVRKIERNGRNIFFGLGAERLCIALCSRIEIWYVLTRLCSLLPRCCKDMLKSVL